VILQQSPQSLKPTAQTSYERAAGGCEGACSGYLLVVEGKPMTNEVLPLALEKSVGTRVIAQLDQRVADVVNEFQISALGQLLAEPDSSADLLAATIREIYWEIHCYQPFTTKAGFSMIGAADPEDRKVMRVLLLHKWEEVEHRVWALDGYKALGGDQSRLGRETELTSPGAFAVAAVWERLARAVHPLAYVGAEYLFEDLTARLAKLVTERLSKRGLSLQGLRFIVDHALEDERHSQLLKRLIDHVVQRHPELASQILFAFDCFHQVYPMPLWLAAYGRAKNALSGGTPLGSTLEIGLLSPYE